VKKKIQNARRAVELSKKIGLPPRPPDAGSWPPNEAVVEHLVMMFTAIEGRKVGRDEVLEFLRQRSIEDRLGIGQDARRPDAKPP